MGASFQGRLADWPSVEHNSDSYQKTEHDRTQKRAEVEVRSEAFSIFGVTARSYEVL
jgi:hypothetical protein